jgi:hypothetical protein
MPQDDQKNHDEATAALLRQRLAGVLPADRIAVEELQELLTKLDRNLLPLSGTSLLTVLLSPTTRMEALESIKGHAKRLAARESRSPPGHDAALAIYFAAIASAVVSHGQKITTHSYEDLVRSFATLIAEPWMAPELANLFAEARKVCQGRV